MSTKPAAKPGPLASLRQRVARWIAPAPSRVNAAVRLYGGARQSRSTIGFGAGGNTSADAELSTSLPILRARSRQMVRDSAYAKRAKALVINNVIGAGVPLQAQVITTRGDPAAAVNDAIEAEWDKWMRADSAHIGGVLHFHDIERMAIGEVFEAGEVFIRMHYAALGTSRVPLSLEVIEAERLADRMVDGAQMAPGSQLRMGIEVNAYGRPLAAWIRQGHPGDLRTVPTLPAERYERVPAADLYHLRVVDRWPQTRGVPWMHAVLRKLDEVNEYTGLELSAARAGAAYFATITTPDPQSPVQDEEEDDGTRVMNIDPLTVQQLAPGEELQFHTPNRPNAALDAFIRHMVREIATGIDGASYEALSGDYSQSNYSSSRMGLLDSRDAWRVLQQWWLRSFRAPLHRVWMQQAVMVGAIQAVPTLAYGVDPDRYHAVRFKPRGWTWVDPTKEVTAYKEAVKAGFMSTGDVIANTAGGADVEDVVQSISRDAELFEAAGIARDTDVGAAVAAPAQPPADPPADPSNDTPADASQADSAARVLPIRRGNAA